MSNETSGNNGRGGLVQLVAYGAEDLILTADPEISFFKNIYMKHVNFSIESINLLFSDSVGFGKTSNLTIKRNGDLLSRLYLELTLPIKEGSTWTNRIGFNIITKVEFYIGRKLIDRMYGIWMHIWTELTHNTDMKNLITKMIGTKGVDGFSDGLTCDVSQTLIIPLFFYFCRNPGLAMPLNAIRNNQDLSLKFYFEKKQTCIQTGDLPDDDITNASVWADYIYLETEQNRLYVQKPLEYLIEVNQYYERNLKKAGMSSIRLPFSLPTKELYWVIYKLNSTKDKFTNFTDDNNNSMVDNVQLIFNAQNVFSKGPLDNRYFNYIQPYYNHKACPDLGINCYSFGLKPEDYNPSGFINFKYISSVNMNIKSKGSGFIHIFAFSYNVLKINYGEINLVYN
jgi:hypothetical protein